MMKIMPALWNIKKHVRAETGYVIGSIILIPIAYQQTFYKSW
jgi:hypothetical protein